jgi:twinkle protein
MSQSKLLTKIQCPKCASNGGDNSEDNLAVYDDGHSYCFSCQYFEQGEAMENVVRMQEDKPVNELVLGGQYRELEHRGITKATCEKYGYQVGDYSGVLGGKPVSKEQVHIANYYDQYNTPIAQKVRGKDKRFTATGAANKMPLYGLICISGLWRSI